MGTAHRKTVDRNPAIGGASSGGPPAGKLPWDIASPDDLFGKATRRRGRAIRVTGVGDRGSGVRKEYSIASLVLPLCSFYRFAYAELVRDVGNLLPLGPARQAFNQPNRTNETNLTNYPKRTSWSHAPAICPLLSACCLLNSDSYLLAPSASGSCSACRGREGSFLPPT
jgi:hypothetical protein